MSIHSRAIFCDLEGKKVFGSLLSNDKDDRAENQHALAQERDDELINEGYLGSVVGGSYSGAMRHTLAQTSRPGRDDKYCG